MSLRVPSRMEFWCCCNFDPALFLIHWRHAQQTGVLRDIPVGGSSALLRRPTNRFISSYSSIARPCLANTMIAVYK